MRSPQIRARGRQAFTLTELLLVIAIIAVLASLISAAVMRARTRMREVACRTEIAQLEDALQTFHTKFNFYPPSRMIICERYDQYFAGPATNPQFISPLHQLSAQTLERMFPRAVDQWRATGIDWNGDGTLTPPVALEGHQCLVFFLGGIPARNPNGCQGFSANPRNPAAPGGDRIGPFFEFQESRLAPVNPANTYFSYIDAYGGDASLPPLPAGATAPRYQVYAYFSAYNRRNGYNAFAGLGNALSTDCPSLQGPPIGPAVWPYCEAFSATNPVPRYLKPETFQIISAGANHVFGSGTPLGRSGNAIVPDPNRLWTVARASLLYPESDPGHDDQSNFHDRLLGAGN